MIDLTKLDNRVIDLLSEATENMYLFIWDLESGISRWSRSSAEYFNLPDKYMKDTVNEWVKHIHSDDRNIFMKDINKILSGKSDKHHCEYRAKDKNGEYQLLSCRGAVERNEDDSVGLFIVTLTKVDNAYQLQQKTTRQYKLQEALQEAIADNFKGFSLVYQPLVHGDSKAVFGAETLMRFSLPNHTPVYPMEFIPILEENGSIWEVGKWLLQTALKQLAEWRLQNPQFVLTVNVSYIQIVRKEFRQLVEEVLNASGLPAEALILELTESRKVLAPRRLKEDFEYLKNKGIGLALDDFGTGYSSISLLRELNPDWIKIDHSCVASINCNELDQSIMESIINLSRQAKIRVCVEGVETKEILEVVQLYQPELLQGYYFSEPCTAESFAEKFLSKKC